MSAFDTACPRCHGKGVSSQQSTPAPTAPPQNYSPTAPSPQPQQYPPQYPAPQYPPQHYTPPPNRSSGISTALGMVLGIGLGCLLLPVVFVLLVGGLTGMGKNLSQDFQKQEQAAVAQEVVVRGTAANITSTGSKYWTQNTITVTGTVKNSGAKDRSLTLEARIYNSSNVLVATGTAWEMIPAGEEKQFSIRVSDNTQTNPFTYKVLIKN
jgi:hypothetical protein